MRNGINIYLESEYSFSIYGTGLSQKKIRNSIECGGVQCYILRVRAKGCQMGLSNKYY